MNSFYLAAEKRENCKIFELQKTQYVLPAAMRVKSLRDKSVCENTFIPQGFSHKKSFPSKGAERLLSW